MTEPDLFAGQWRDIAGVLAAPRPAEPQPEPAADGVPPLTPAERKLLGVAALLALAVSILGLLSSYTSLNAKAGPGGWGWEWPWLLPVGMDLSIPAFTLVGLLLIRTDMPLAWVPFVPRALTGATVYLNWAAAQSIPGKIGHAVLTLLWVVFSEIAGHVYASMIGAVTGKRMEKVRRIRWILAPLSTAAIWRRMNLWEETSYRTALARQRDRLLSRAGLRETHGWTWRWTAPRRDRVLLRLGDLNPADAFPSETAETGSTTTGETETTTTIETSQRAETKPVHAERRDLPAPETKTSPVETETTVSPRSETSETTATTVGLETGADSTPETETPKVSTLRDRDPEAEVQILLGLMRDQKSETTVGLKDAIRETGRPKATAAKRLKVARDRYRAETAA